MMSRKAKLRKKKAMADERDVETRIDLRRDPIMREGRFCLCGRDPESTEVREELSKALALSTRYNVDLGGCLEDAADAFDEIFENLLPKEARRLEQIMQGIHRSLKGAIGESVFSGEARPEEALLH